LIPYKIPSFKAGAFNCPTCNAYSNQIWHDIIRTRIGTNEHYSVGNLFLAMCNHCKTYSLWLDEKIIYPDISGIPMPNPDLNEDIKADYNEARSIVNKSPRGATALLRLCIQKLCEELGESGSNINTDIANLVKKGLPPTIQQALDIVRVIGNNAVHPGQIDLKDDVETANKLFELVNIITHIMITQPKEIEKLYQALPENQRKAIEERDRAKP